ncbi:General transcription factor IIF subunit 1 [Frankliniella fusca]|uniref:General transcription factor IIF subunit 1 n=1 Tax=Frankliniella fusca TaxID=407009 RepID=A0AAE1LK03_9NEOP|nr:General transcription factor IIF subunit 1 [Frankliniella fusca]
MIMSNVHASEETAMLAEVERMEKEEKKPAGSKSRGSTSPGEPNNKWLQGGKSTCVTQATANAAVVGYIVDEMEPVAKCIYCPSRKTVNNIIADKHDEMMTDTKKKLQDAPYNIATVINNVHKDQGIDGKGKIVNCVTENASNFAKAYRIYFPSQTQLAWRMKRRYSVTGGMRTTNVPPQKRCFAHTLNLIMTTDCDLKNISNNIYNRLHTSAFSKVGSLWNMGSRSTKASDCIAEIAGVKFPVPNKTRWNAYPDAISNLMEKREVLDDVLEKLNLPKLKLIELDFLGEYVKVSEPISTDLNVLQGDKYCHFGLALPTLLVINKKMDAMRNFVHCAPLHAKIKSGIQERFGRILDIRNAASQEYVVAAISLPQFKLHFLNHGPYIKAEIDHARSLFISACEEAQQELEDEQDPASLASVKITVEEVKKANVNKELPPRVADFFGDIQLPPSAQTQLNENTARLEALTYLEDKDQDYSIQHKYPIVKRVFIKYNVKLPSSALVERLFSAGGQVLTPRRGHLGWSSV